MINEHTVEKTFNGRGLTLTQHETVSTKLSIKYSGMLMVHELEFPNGTLSSKKNNNLVTQYQQQYPSHY